MKPAAGVNVNVPLELNTTLPRAGSVALAKLSASPSGSVSFFETSPVIGAPNRPLTLSSTATGAGFVTVSLNVVVTFAVAGSVAVTLTV